jgi:hypothetical protein
MRLYCDDLPTGWPARVLVAGGYPPDCAARLLRARRAERKKAPRRGVIGQPGAADGDGSVAGEGRGRPGVRARRPARVPSGPMLHRVPGATQRPVLKPAQCGCGGRFREVLCKRLYKKCNHDGRTRAEVRSRATSRSGSARAARRWQCRFLLQARRIRRRARRGP